MVEYFLLVQGLKRNDERCIFGSTFNKRTIQHQSCLNVILNILLMKDSKQGKYFLYFYPGSSMQFVLPFSHKNLLCLKIILFVMYFLLQKNHFFVWLFMICCESFESPPSPNFRLSPILSASQEYFPEHTEKSNLL